MKSFSLFLAWRYMRGARHAQAIGTMVYVSCIALAIASGALALTMCIMRGFEKSGHQLLQGVHAPIIMSSGQDPLDFQAIAPILKTEFPEIIGFSPRITEHGIIKDPLTGELSAPVLLQGILPDHEIQTTKLASYIKRTLFPHATLTDLLVKNQVLIGERLAKQFALHVGDTVELVYSSDTTTSRSKLYLSTTPIIISGIFKTGLEEMDAGTIYCPLSLLQKLFSNAEVTQLAIKPTTLANQDKLITQLQQRFGLDVYSWQSLYPALISALELEKYAMFLIVSLIILIASMTILSLLYMQIQHKRSDIALLHALGVPSNTITCIFMWMGLIIAAFSSLAGLSLAAIAAWVLEKYQLIPLPDTYMISHLPVALEWPIFIGIFFFVICVALVSTWIPCRALHKISIARLLKSQA
ncbi:MAG: FtsX-like permease family protein [Candidatus Babeliales bacterium]